MKVTKVDASVARLFRSRLDETIADLAQEMGLRLTIGNITYNSGEMRMKLTAKIDGSEGEDSGPDPYFLMMMERYQIDPEKVYDMANGRKTDRIKFVDYVPRRPKYPFTVEVQGSGKRYKLDCRTAQRVAGVPNLAKR